jgi:anti-anti-sigma factor
MLSHFSPVEPSDDQPRRATLRVDLVTPDPDTLLVIPVGEADLSTANRLRQALEEGIDARPSNVVVDLDHLDFMDATTLDVLAQARSRICAAGGQLRVRCHGDLAREMLALTGMDELIQPG